MHFIKLIEIPKRIIKNKTFYTYFKNLDQVFNFPICLRCAYMKTIFSSVHFVYNYLFRRYLRLSTLNFALSFNITIYYLKFNLVK